MSKVHELKFSENVILRVSVKVIYVSDHSSIVRDDMK